MINMKLIFTSAYKNRLYLAHRTRCIYQVLSYLFLGSIGFGLRGEYDPGVEVCEGQEAARYV